MRKFDRNSKKTKLFKAISAAISVLLLGAIGTYINGNVEQLPKVVQGSKNQSPSPPKELKSDQSDSILDQVFDPNTLGPLYSIWVQRAGYLGKSLSSTEMQMPDMSRLNPRKRELLTAYSKASTIEDYERLLSLVSESKHGLSDVEEKCFMAVLKSLTRKPTLSSWEAAVLAIEGDPAEPFVLLAASLGTLNLSPERARGFAKEASRNLAASPNAKAIAEALAATADKWALNDDSYAASGLEAFFTSKKVTTETRLVFGPQILAARLSDRKLTDKQAAVLFQRCRDLLSDAIDLEPQVAQARYPNTIPMLRFLKFESLMKSKKYTREDLVEAQADLLATASDREGFVFWSFSFVQAAVKMQIEIDEQVFTRLSAAAGFSKNEDDRNYHLAVAEAAEMIRYDGSVPSDPKAALDHALEAKRRLARCRHTHIDPFREFVLKSIDDLNRHGHIKGQKI